MAKERSMIDVKKCTLILDGFFKESDHLEYEGFVPSSECLKLEVIREPDNKNNTDELVNPEVENVFMNGTFNVSNGQEPSYNFCLRHRVTVLTWFLPQKYPKLLTCGGSYANFKDVGIENFHVTMFPFGIGGPKMRHQTKV